MFDAVVAHQGGWDEILLVAGPLAVFAGVLYLANRRATAKLAATNTSDASTTGAAAVAAEVNDEA